MAAQSPSPKGTINVGIYDGTRDVFPQGTKVLYYVYDGNHKQVVSRFAAPEVSFKVPFRDNLADNYTVVVTLDAHGTSGYYPIPISPKSIQVVRLMLLPDAMKFDFSVAAWGNLQQAYPRIWNLLAGRVADAANGNPNAQGAYEDLIKNSPKVVACLLNILAAMEQIQLGGEVTPLDFVKDILWQDAAHLLQQDRFYCWVDSKLISAILEAKDMFKEAPILFHGPTASRSWKEDEFGEANVQFTFHESVKHPKHADWVMLEPDIDYFKDPAAHFFGEVFVNWFGSITEPAQVYKLRWLAGNRPGSIPFQPPYVIV